MWCDAQSAEGARRLLLKRSSYKTPEMIASSNAAAARLILEKHPRFAGLQRVSRVHPTTTWMQAYRRARTMASADASASPVQFLNEVALLRVVVSTLIDSLDLRADAPRGWGGLELEVLRPHDSAFAALAQKHGVKGEPPNPAVALSRPDTAAVHFIRSCISWHQGRQCVAYFAAGAA